MQLPIVVFNGPLSTSKIFKLPWFASKHLESYQAKNIRVQVKLRTCIRTPMLIVIVEYNWITLNHILHSHWSLAPSSIHPQPLRKKKHSGFHTLLPSKLQEPFSCAGGVSGEEPPILGSDGIGENTKQRPWTLLVTPRSSSPPGKCPAVKLSIWGNGQTMTNFKK